ncbi:cytidine deaminase [Chloroflexota bacterium]
MLDDKNIDRLISIAKFAREKAYAPYSNQFKVGAAVLVEDGSIFSGCNVENASFGATVCAERIAIFKAISEGHDSILAVAVIADYPQPISPCGMCLQVISEFGEDIDVIMTNIKGEIEKSNLKNLLPKSFRFET